MRNILDGYAEAVKAAMLAFDAGWARGASARVLKGDESKPEYVWRKVGYELGEQSRADARGPARDAITATLADNYCDAYARTVAERDARDVPESELTALREALTKQVST